MYKVLSAKEIEQYKKDREVWWENLSDEWKSKLQNIFHEATSPDYITNPEKYTKKENDYD